MIPIAPFTKIVRPGSRTTNSFWSDIGCIPDDSTQDVFVNGVNETHTVNYNQRTSVALVEGDEQSFLWDSAGDSSGQLLYFHMTHTTFPDESNMFISYGGFYNDTDFFTIDSIACLPLLRSIPKLSQKADIIAYPKFALMSGQMEFDATAGAMAQFMGADVFGSRADAYYLPPGKIDYLSSELTAIGAFYVEDFEWTLARFILTVQDKRKSQQNALLTQTLLDGTLTPILYGTAYIAKCLPYTLVATTGNVTFQIAQELTDIGTIQVFDDTTKMWITKSPVSTNLSTGQFVLAYADCRAGGAIDGGFKNVRALLPKNKPTRIHATLGDNACYVIVDLLCQFLGIQYVADFFNTTEIDAAASVAGLIGVVFDSQIPLLDAIAQIQNGCLVGLRYEVTTDGRYTIRVDDNDRANSGYIPWQKIKDNLTLKISSQSINLVSSVTIQYNHDYNDDIYLLEKSDDALELTAFNRYGVKKNIDTPTLLTNQTDAAIRAAYQIDRQNVVMQLVDINLHGQEYYNLRIYDILHIELQPEGSRQYYGTWKVKIMSIAPDFKGLSNNITALLLEEI